MTEWSVVSAKRFCGSQRICQTGEIFSFEQKKWKEVEWKNPLDFRCGRFHFAFIEKDAFLENWTPAKIVCWNLCRRKESSCFQNDEIECRYMFLEHFCRFRVSGFQGKVTILKRHGPRQVQNCWLRTWCLKPSQSYWEISKWTLRYVIIKSDVFRFCNIRIPTEEKNNYCSLEKLFPSKELSIEPLILEVKLVALDSLKIGIHSIPDIFGFTGFGLKEKHWSFFFRKVFLWSKKLLTETLIKI